MFVIVFSLDIILTFSKIVILEFFDSPTQILVGFFPEKQSVGRATRPEHFLDGRPRQNVVQDSCTIDKIPQEVIF